MERKEAKKRISYGQDSHTPFKQSIREGTDLAAEMVAFSNARGGVIFVGVEDKTGMLSGIPETPLQETGWNWRTKRVRKGFPFPDGKKSSRRKSCNLLTFEHLV